MSVKKRKFSLKKTFRIIIPFIIIILLLFNFNTILYFCQGKISGYSMNTIKILHNLDLYSDVRKKDYSETLDKIINTDKYRSDYTKYYVDISFNNDKDFFNNINKLIDIGYNAKDVNTIYSKLDNSEINILLKNKYFKDITNVLNLSYFKNNNLLRYIKYSEDDVFGYEDNVTFVNIGLDKDYYSDVITSTDTDSVTILVNKYHSLDSKYIPNDLEKIDSKYNRGNNNLMRKEAKEAFQKMCEGALKDNITIYSGSAYRSYNYQLNLYNRYVSIDGKRKAETYAARAGYSEHQTGLATDIMNKRLEYISSSDEEYTWLVNNSYKYGFILRYPKGKEDITGYMYEEWHYRYIGVEEAKNVFNSKLTYDEYIARK